MNTNDYKTKSFLKEGQNTTVASAWPIAIDIGYSAVKGMAPNKVFCFPAYAKKLKEEPQRFKKPNEFDILFRDADGIFAVGEMALSYLDEGDTNDSNMELFGRKRYTSTVFHVVALTGIGIGLMTNSLGNPEGKKVKIQTGLPPKYIKADTTDLKEALTGDFEFELRIGANDWQKFHIKLEDDDIYVIKQPLGSLISVSTNSDGTPYKDAQKYFSSNLVVLDPGFGTLDLFSIKQGNVDGDGETFDNLGMREILQRTCDDIFERFGTEISVPYIQNRLKDGYIKTVNKKSMSSETHDFSGILEENTRKVFGQALDKMKLLYNYFQDIDYLLVTGGTSDAWKNEIYGALKNMKSLTIIKGNQNDTSLSNVFSNVRGYYLYLINTLKHSKEL